MSKRVSKLTNQSSLPVRMRPCESLKLQSIQLLGHCILNMLYNNTASEKKKYDLSLFEKERKIQKYLMYLTSSKVVKETSITFESNYKIDAS